MKARYFLSLRHPPVYRDSWLLLCLNCIRLLMKTLTEQPGKGRVYFSLQL